MSHFASASGRLRPRRLPGLCPWTPLGDASPMPHDVNPLHCKILVTPICRVQYIVIRRSVIQLHVLLYCHFMQLKIYRAFT